MLCSHGSPHGSRHAHTSVQALTGLALYAAATVMDNRTMCHLWPKHLQRLARISLCLAWIAIAALTIATATVHSSAASRSAKFWTALSVSEDVTPCSGASDCDAGACSAVGCFSYVAIESRALDLGSNRLGSIRLPLSREAPSFSTAPQPHPPRI